jgi:hypothetical protein
MEVDEDNFPCKKIHRSNSITDAVVRAIGIAIWVWISLEHHGLNPSHHGSQEEGPNHAATETDPYTIAKHSVKCVASLDPAAIPPLSPSQQHPQQQIVDSDGSDAQIQSNPRNAFKTASTIKRTRSDTICADLDVSFFLL